MTRLFRRRFLKTSLLAFATSMILIPAASAMPVLSDSADGTQTQPAFVNLGPYDGYVTRTADKPIITSHWAKPAFVNLGPYDGYITRTADKPLLSPAAQAAPIMDSWYTPAVLGTSDDVTATGRATPDVPPVAGRAVPVLSSPSGFDWGDAGLALALGAALAAFFVFGAQRARRERHVPIPH